jgi:thiol-disulfide isomerase/thioredoxin
VVDVFGNKTQIAFDGTGNTLILVFSSTCGACQQTLPVWNRLLAEHSQSAVHVVGIETDFEPNNASSANLPIPDLRFPVYGAANPAGEPMTKFPAIPAAALVDGHGAVKSVWFGTPGDEQVAELRRAIGLS